MALKLLNSGRDPLGQFDGLDSEVLTLKGGEVVTFTSVVATAATDVGAADAFDGYVNPNKRAVVTRTLSAGSRPLMLADEGIAGYGTLFGTVVGGTVGQTVYGPGSTVPASAQLGPHTATGSGKVTCWDKPGLYAVTLDAVDTTSGTGLTLDNATLATGAELHATSTGLLTPAAGTGDIVGRFVEFETNRSLVTTPNTLVSALASAKAASYVWAVFHFSPEV